MSNNEIFSGFAEDIPEPENTAPAPEKTTDKKSDFFRALDMLNEEKKPSAAPKADEAEGKAYENYRQAVFTYGDAVQEEEFASLEEVTAKDAKDPHSV